MKEIQLNEEDIKELKNIINCLQSKDKEIFQLGKSLFETKFPINLLIPIGDILIPFKLHWENFYFDTFRFIQAEVKPYVDSYKNIFILLKYLIESKYYVLSENN